MYREKLAFKPFHKAAICVSKWCATPMFVNVFMCECDRRMQRPFRSGRQTSGKSTNSVHGWQGTPETSCFDVIFVLRRRYCGEKHTANSNIQ